MQGIPLQPVPNQQLQIVLNGQNCQIAVYARGSRLFVDTAVNGSDISIAVIARNGISLVPTSYLGFSGQLMFIDTQGSDDPQVSGLGARWQLVYLSPSDVAGLEVIGPLAGVIPPPQ